jgi:hypothetical protein
MAGRTALALGHLHFLMAGPTPFFMEIVGNTALLNNVKLHTATARGTDMTTGTSHLGLMLMVGQHSRFLFTGDVKGFFDIDNFGARPGKRCGIKTTEKQTATYQNQYFLHY